MATQLIKQLAVICIALVNVGHASPFLPESDSDASSYQHLQLQLVRRDVIEDTCYLKASTYAWTTCTSFLETYNITLAEFAALNPSVGADCTSFVPQTEYCMRKRKSERKHTYDAGSLEFLLIRVTRPCSLLPPSINRRFVRRRIASRCDLRRFSFWPVLW